MIYERQLHAQACTFGRSFEGLFLAPKGQTARGCGLVCSWEEKVALCGREEQGGGVLRLAGEHQRTWRALGIFLGPFPALVGDPQEGRGYVAISDFVPALSVGDP